MYAYAAHLGRPARCKVVRLLQSRLELRIVKQPLRLGQQHTTRLPRDKIVHAGFHQHHSAVFHGLDQYPNLPDCRSASIPQRFRFLVLHVDISDHRGASVELILEAGEVSSCFLAGW
jgi:hypothetical protein